MTYQLVDKNGKLTIIEDETGAPVTFDAAHAVINQLMDTYAHPAYVYLACRPTRPRMIYKIGMSGQVPEKRMSQLRYHENDDRIFLLHTIACKTSQSALSLESRMHEWFAEQRLRGEWYRLFSEDVEFIADIKSETEATSKHFKYFMGDMMEQSMDDTVAWILSRPEDEQTEIMKTVDQMLDLLNGVITMMRQNQLRLPEF